MADAPEIRGDSVTTSTETAAKAEPFAKVEAPAQAETAIKAEPLLKAEAAPQPDTAVKLEAAAKAEAATGMAAAWIAKLRSGFAIALPVNRPALMAGGIGFAIGVGLLVGTVGAMGVGRLIAAPTPAPAPWNATAEETRALKQTVAKLEGQLAGLKSSVEAVNRQFNAQRSQSTERYERSARTQNEIQARLAKVGDVVDRLEKRVTAAAAAEATGSVAPRYAATAAGANPTPSVEAKKPSEPPIADGWVIREVFRGRALVANRRGVFEAAPGLFLPDLGRVESITRDNGRWKVVAEKGIITTVRRPRSTYSYDAD